MKNYLKFKHNLNTIMTFNFKNNKLLLGRWNKIDKDKYLNWANSDNCCCSSFSTGTEEKLRSINININNNNTK